MTAAEQQSDAGAIEFRRFDASPTDPQSIDWLHAAQSGFYEGRSTEEHINLSLKASETDGRVFTGVYDNGQGASALDTAVPVATYATMQHSLNTGGGRRVPVHQITSVTVRPTHRRRGLLRELMTDDLARARKGGLSVAALTATEASIYGRFGFGVSTFLHSVEVVTDERFRITGGTIGRMEMTDPRNLESWAPEIFDLFHAFTLGSLGRQHRYALSAAGLWGRKPEPDPDVRAAVHVSADGTRDGYVSYRFEGWDSDTPTVQIVDLVAATPEVYRELWRFLGSLDLVTLIKYGAASPADPLPWMLSDRRAYRVKAERDHLWLRILDTVGALQSRQWPRDGALTLCVQDPLGLAGGVFRIEVSDGSANVRDAGDASRASADVEVDIQTLSSLYLGATGDAVQALAAAGGIRELREGGTHDLEHLFATTRIPYCITGF